MFPMLYHNKFNNEDRVKIIIVDIQIKVVPHYPLCKRGRNIFNPNKNHKNIIGTCIRLSEGIILTIQSIWKSKYFEVYQFFFDTLYIIVQEECLYYSSSCKSTKLVENSGYAHILKLFYLSTCFRSYHSRDIMHKL